MPFRRPDRSPASFTAARLSRYALAFAVAIAFLSSPGSALADWTVYLSGVIGISTGKGEVSGTAGPVSFDSSDRDSSPMISGAVGLEIPLDELMAWDLPYELELPDWPFRGEIEFAGLRDFEYITAINQATPVADIYLTSNSSWAMMVNAFLDMPTTPLARPLAWTFQTRRSAIRRALDPITFYAGAGVGTASVKLDAINSFLWQAQASDFKFAWQVGTGFAYQLTPFVNLDVGYRFFKTKQSSPTLRDAVGDISNEDFAFNQHVNEFRFGLRVNLYSFTSPWERLE